MLLAHVWVGSGIKMGQEVGPGYKLPSNLLLPTELPLSKVPPSPKIGPLSGEQRSNP